MDNQQGGPGFSPHLQNQLSQASQQVSQRGRGRGRGRNYNTNQPHRQQPQHGPPPALDAYPPLGANQTYSRAPSTISSHSSQPYSGMPRAAPSQQNYSDGQPRHFSYFPGSNSQWRQWQQNQQAQPQPQHQPQVQPHAPRQFQGRWDEFVRPPGPHGTLYQQNPRPPPNAWSSNLEDQRLFRHQVMAQGDHLNRLQHEARAKYQLKQEESITKEAFRKRLERLSQETLAKQYPDLDASAVRLKCYGSLNNGFGLAGCDMDLLLCLPEDFKPPVTALPALKARLSRKDSTATASTSEEATASDDVSEHSKQAAIFALGSVLVKALLDESYGARLLTKTRVPILKVCESPDDDLLKRLRRYHSDEMKALTNPDAAPMSNFSLPPSFDTDALSAALATLEDQEAAALIPLPDLDNQGKQATDLEFGAESGIKCDINFSNDLALKNTRLLREYCLIDPRVAEVGVFVKTWAKIRDINTPYYGTLSSYGYVLMVLHFLMNVVSPAVIPNLQHLARSEDEWDNRETVELYEGKYDVRFLTDHKTINQYRNGMSTNKATVGNLIRGFFWYYSDPSGFNWKNEIISIRTRGGILRKDEKGWTGAKWSDNADKKNVRLRYLMAIEDPFETDHNVARVVGHNGIVAIRDEFRRAWNIISNIGVEGAVTEDLMKPMKGRGDTLRKDQDHHREKMKQLRQMAEAKQQAQPSKTDDSGASANVQPSDPSDVNGMWSDNDSSSQPPRLLPENISPTEETESKLTPWVPTYRDKPRQSGQRKRVVAEDSDDEDADGDDERTVEKPEEHVELPQETAMAAGAEDQEFTAGSPAAEQECAEPSVTEQEGAGPQGVKHAEPAFESTTSIPSPLERPDPEKEKKEIAQLILTHAFDDSGNPKAWDQGTKEGRWLEWRDNKIRHGKKFPENLAGEFAELHATCPFDHRRPIAPIHGVRDHNPPFSMSKISTERASSYQSYELFEPQAVKSVPHRAFGTQICGNQSHSPELSVQNPSSTVTTTTVIKAGNLEDRPVRLPIPYTHHSAGGKWLKKRDAMLRRNALDVNNLHEWEKKLHETFPYNPGMMLSELRDVNKQLKRDWRFKPAGGGETEIISVATGHEPQVTNVNETQSSKEDVQNQHSLSEAPINISVDMPIDETVKADTPELPAIGTLPDEKEPDSDNDTVTIETMPDSAFLRSRRLAYYTKPSAPAQQGSNSCEKEPETITTRMADAGIDIDRPNLTKKGSAAGIWAGSDTEEDNSKRREGAYTSFLSNATTAVERNIKSKLSHAKVDDSRLTEDASENSMTVPATLMPDTPSEERPPHENPNVMPIPRNVGFKFDVRQLRDLAVIKAGGNGCARAGEEYNIEEDYEFGGGGEMGYRSSSGMPQSSGRYAEEYEYGRGDDERLLHELPGYID
jgi:terminal uridylyltransferase